MIVSNFWSLHPFKSLGMISFLKLKHLIFLVVPFSIFSCVNLKSVSDFSSTSMAGLQHFEAIDYTFLDHCEDRCTEVAVHEYSIDRELECDCEVFVEADSVTQVIYTTIQGYLQGLGNLAHNDLTTYRTNDLTLALTAQQLGPVSIDETVVNAFSALSNTLLRSTTDFYRRRKIASYIEEANEPMQVLLDKFQQIIQANLKGELRFKKERLYGNFIEMKLNNTLQSEYEKRKAGEDYYQALSDINRLEKLLDVYAQSLDQVASGHQVLYDRRDKLSVKDLAGTLMNYSSEIELLYAEFNKLNQ